LLHRNVGLFFIPWELLSRGHLSLTKVRVEGYRIRTLYEHFADTVLILRVYNESKKSKEGA
jgi:mRNA-degrading endonuclease RelE of RelBE toxin-antitoxin system